MSLQGINYDGPSQLNIPNTPDSGTNFPTFNIGENVPSLGSSNFDRNVDTGILGEDTVSWQKGRHSLRFGGTYRWQQFSYENNGPAAGTFNFSRAQTSAYNNGTIEADSGNGVASFLLGVTSNTNRTIPAPLPALDAELLRRLRAGRLEGASQPHRERRLPLQRRHAPP